MYNMPYKVGQEADLFHQFDQLLAAEEENEKTAYPFPIPSDRFDRVCPYVRGV